MPGLTYGSVRTSRPPPARHASSGLSLRRDGDSSRRFGSCFSCLHFELFDTRLASLRRTFVTEEQHARMIADRIGGGTTLPALIAVLIVLVVIGLIVTYWYVVVPIAFVALIVALAPGAIRRYRKNRYFASEEFLKHK